MWETSRSDTKSSGSLPRGQTLKTVSLLGQRCQTPGTHWCDLFLFHLTLRGCLDNSTQWIISPSYLLREFCTFGGYAILEIKLNAHPHWAHLACHRGLATAAEGGDPAGARPWEQTALSMLISLGTWKSSILMRKWNQLIFNFSRLRQRDISLRQILGLWPQRTLCSLCFVSAARSSERQTWAWRTRGSLPCTVKDGWSEPTVRSGIQETPNGSSF